MKKELKGFKIQKLKGIYLLIFTKLGFGAWSDNILESREHGKTGREG